MARRSTSTQHACTAFALGAVLLLGCGQPSSDASAPALDITVEASPTPALRNAVVICMDTVRFDVFRAIQATAHDPFQEWSQLALEFERLSGGADGSGAADHPGTQQSIQPLTLRTQ